MSLGGGYSQSESDQRSQSFGPLGSASGTLRGAGQGSLFGNIFGAGNLIDTATLRTRAPVEYTLPSLSPRGLTTEQEAQAGLTEQSLRTPFQQAVEQALGRTSGNYAMRGFNRPENIQAIAGSAAQNVAPQFAQLFANLGSQYQGLGTQNVMQRTQAPLVREDVIRNRFADLLNALGLGTTALGGEATSYGSSKSMGVQAQYGSKGGGGSTPSMEGIG